MESHGQLEYYDWKFKTEKRRTEVEKSEDENFELFYRIDTDCKF